MIRFKDLLTEPPAPLSEPSVTLALKNGPSLQLRFDSKDTVTAASYSGKSDIWLASLCVLVLGKKLTQLQKMGLFEWDKTWGQDQFYCDLRSEIQEDCIFPALELLRASLDVYRAQDHVYHQLEPLVCRCFGVRENEIVQFLQTAENPDLDSLAKATKAGMGCRTCVPQLKRWVTAPPAKEKKHYYKERPIADWLMEIDYMLSCFPDSAGWNMEVLSMRGNQVKISFDKDVTQKQAEEQNSKLQGFLGPSVDEDLAFFLSRSRQR